MESRATQPGCPKVERAPSRARTRLGRRATPVRRHRPGTALDDDLDLPQGLDRRALLERIEDHVIEQARVIGTYANSG